MPATSSKTKAVLTVFTGSDDFTLKKESAEWVRQHTPEDPMNLETIEGEVDTVEAAITNIGRVREAILTVPFFGGKKLVWWKNVSFLGDTVQGRSEAVLEALEGLLTEMEKVDATSVRMVISAGKIDKRRAFYKAMTKLAEVKIFDLPDDRRGRDEIFFRINTMLREKGLDPDPGVAERILEGTGILPQYWQNEVEKLALYLGPDKKRVTLKDVQLMVVGNREAEIWDFCDAVMEGKVAEAMEIIPRLNSKEVNEVRLMNTLMQQVLWAIAVKILIEKKLVSTNGRNFYEVTEEGKRFYPQKKSGELIKPFQFNSIAQKIGNSPVSFWLRYFECLYQTYIEMLNGRIDQERALEMVVFESQRVAQG